MADDFNVMPDYLAALERELRERAAAGPVANAVVRRKRRWRSPALALAFAAVVVIAVLVPGGSVRRDSTAYGKPAILKTKPIAVPASMRPGLVIRAAAGQDVTLSDARPIKGLAGHSYLLSGGGLWCLAVRDTSAPHAGTGFSCVKTPDFLTFGLTLLVGRHCVAVVPSGVPDPTLRHSDGTTEPVPPDAQGVISVHLQPGETIVLHGTNGEEQVYHAR